MISAIVSRIVILLFGTLYPAYASYKAVRTKNVKEYVKWMMYWIVFAFFTCIETFTDILLSWFPFYYEIKVVIVLWLLSPATRGSSTLYRKFVHPMLTRREQEIDDYINQAKEKGYTAVLQLGSKGVNYATNVIMQTAIKAFNNPQQLTGSMLRHSQSDNSLASAGISPSHRTYSLGDETDGPSPSHAVVVDSEQMVTRSTRAKRSQSVDSALNKVASGQAQPQSDLKHSIIYELDSEEEDHLLAQFAAQHDPQLNGTNGWRDETTELEDGAARSRVTQKRKTAATTTTASSTRTRKPAGSGVATTAAGKPAATTRGRKKLRKDSETMEVEVD